jgi:hypothetical protein
VVEKVFISRKGEKLVLVGFMGGHLLGIFFYRHKGSP